VARSGYSNQEKTTVHPSGERTLDELEGKKPVNFVFPDCNFSRRNSTYGLTPAGVLNILSRQRRTIAWGVV
jgi:hypothetical protein